VPKTRLKVDAQKSRATENVAFDHFTLVIEDEAPELSSQNEKALRFGRLSVAMGWQVRAANERVQEAVKIVRGARVKRMNGTKSRRAPCRFERPLEKGLVNQRNAGSRRHASRLPRAFPPWPRQLMAGLRNGEPGSFWRERSAEIALRVS
jgi:hypothetical protein